MTQVSTSPPPVRPPFNRAPCAQISMPRSVPTMRDRAESEEQLAERAVGGRVRRLIQLVSLVQTGSAISSAELSEELCVTRRTIFRDIRTLQDAGVPIRSRRGGGYSIRHRPMIFNHSLTCEEMVGLMLLAKLAEGIPESNTAQAALSVVQRIMAPVPREEREACERELLKQLARLGL